MRIALWWSFYIAAADAREVTDYFIPELEQRLGHGLQLRQDVVADETRPDLYRADLWSYLAAETIEQAAHAALHAALRLSPRVSVPFPINATPDESENAIVAYYWDDCAAAGLPGVLSSGVQARYSRDFEPSLWPDLAAYDPNVRAEVEAWREAILTAPLIELGPSNHRRHDYRLDLDLRVYASTSANLLDSQWPTVRRRWFANSAEIIQVAKRSYDRGPFRLSVRKHLDHVTEDQAICTCLRYGAHDGLSLDTDEYGSVQSLSALHATQDKGVNNIVAYTLTRL